MEKIATLCNTVHVVKRKEGKLKIIKWKRQKLKNMSYTGEGLM